MSVAFLRYINSEYIHSKTLYFIKKEIISYTDVHTKTQKQNYECDIYKYGL